MSKKTLAVWVAAACVVAVSSASTASAGVWNSVGEADWNTGPNWDTGIVPSSGWTPVAGAGAPTLASGTATFAGPDFNVLCAPLTLSGGSLKMTGGAGSNLWVAWGGANSSVTVNAGSTLEFWQMFVGSAIAPGSPNPANAGSVNVTGGDVVGETVFITDDSTIHLSAGSVTMEQVLHLRDGSFVMSGGTLDSPGLAFDGSGTVLTLSGGQIDLGWGIYSASDGHIDFTESSTGVVHLAGDIAGSLAMSLLTSGRVRYVGVTDAAAFEVTVDATGSYIAAVPEPVSSVVLSAALASLAIRRRARR